MDYRNFLMHRVAATLFLLAVTAYGGAPLTVGGVTYENVTLKKEYPRSLFIKHDGGTAFIERSALSEEQLAQVLDAAGGSASAGSATNTAPEDDYNEAKALLQEEDDGANWSKAVDLMRRAAEAGYPAAQYEWAMILIDSFCVPQDVEKAGEFLRKAADAGHGRAMLELLGAEKDQEKFMQGIQRAAEAGDGTAMVLMVSPTARHNGEKPEYSRNWLDKALASNDAMAMTTAAGMLGHWARDPKALGDLGMTAEEMQAKAVEALRKACDEKFLGAYCSLAERLRKGTGVEKNEEESKALMEEFKKLTDQKNARGSINAQFALVDSLNNSKEADANDESLRIVAEILAKSDYPKHHMIAALSGAVIVERQESDKTEGIRRALAWLKERQAERESESVGVFITNFENRLSKTATQ